jgi:tetratricopeptide (TPR) repeat protein
MQLSSNDYGRRLAARGQGCAQYFLEAPERLPCGPLFQIDLAQRVALIADYALMEISLANGRYRSALLAASILIAALVSFQAVQLWLANRWIHSEKIHLVERGAALVPSDGSAWDNLGRLRQWSLKNPDLPGAIAAYRKALRENPLAAGYWMDLAGGYEASGNDSAAADAFAHAQAVYPDSSEVAFNYGNFLLRRQEYSSAFAQLRRAVRGDPSLLPLAIFRAWRASGDANQIIGQLLPATANSYVQAIDYLVTIHQCDAALAIWSRLMNSKAAVPLTSSFALIDELIREDRSADARRSWRDAVSNARLPVGYSDDSSVVWNGDFANDLVGGGLGWHWDSLPGSYLSFDGAPPQSKGRALRIDFNGGSNVSLAAPYEYVPVDPGQAYHFQAMMRTDAVTTESGPRFSISDPNHPAVVSAVTENFTGTHGWTPVEVDLTTGAETHFLVVRLVRPPSRLFDNKLGGTVWIASVSLVSVHANAEPSR